MRLTHDPARWPQLARQRRCASGYTWLPPPAPPPEKSPPTKRPAPTPQPFTPGCLADRLHRLLLALAADGDTLPSDAALALSLGTSESQVVRSLFFLTGRRMIRTTCAPFQRHTSRAWRAITVTFPAGRESTIRTPEAPADEVP